MDTVSDALSKIKNGSMANQENVELKFSNEVLEIVKILKDEAFIDDYSSDKKEIVVTLGYVGREPKITNLQRISKPGQRVYIRASELKPVLNGRGIGIISTSKGLMTIDEAKSKNLGGEYICKIW